MGCRQASCCDISSSTTEAKSKTVHRVVPHVHVVADPACSVEKSPHQTSDRSPYRRTQFMHGRFSQLNVAPTAAPCDMQSKFSGAVMVPGGHDVEWVYCAPSRADCLLAYSPKVGELRCVDVATSMPVGSGHRRFCGIAAIPPLSAQSGASSSKKGINAASAVAQLSGGKGWMVVCAPFDLDRMLIYDLISGAFIGVDVTGVASGREKFSGCVCCNGVVVCAPYRADNLLAYDLYSGKARGIDVVDVAGCGAASSKDALPKFCGAAVCGDGKVVCAPFGAERLIIYNVVTDEIQGIPLGSIPRGVAKFSGVACCGDKVVCAPFQSDVILVYSLSTGVINGVKFPFFMNDFPRAASNSQERWMGHFSGATSVGDDVFLAPSSAPVVLSYNTKDDHMSGAHHLLGQSARNGNEVTPSTTQRCGGWCDGIACANGRVLCAPSDLEHCLLYILDGAEVTLSEPVVVDAA